MWLFSRLNLTRAWRCKEVDVTAITYTAERSLSPGHIQGSSYTISVRTISRGVRKDVAKKSLQSMSGKNVETNLWRNNKKLNIQTASVRGGERELILEFLESVIGGETFSFDEFGYAGSPDNAVNAWLDGDYRETRSVRLGDGGRDDYFRYSFTVAFFSA